MSSAMYERMRANPKFQELVGKRTRFATILAAIVLSMFYGFVMVVAFNPDYIMEPLRNLVTDEVFFEMTDELSPGVIKCDVPFIYVLMPMRVG